MSCEFRGLLKIRRPVPILLPSAALCAVTVMTVGRKTSPSDPDGGPMYSPVESIAPRFGEIDQTTVWFAERVTRAENWKFWPGFSSTAVLTSSTSNWAGTISIALILGFDKTGNNWMLIMPGDAPVVSTMNERSIETFGAPAVARMSKLLNTCWLLRETLNFRCPGDVK